MNNNNHEIHYIIAYTCNNLGDDLLILSLLRRFPYQQFYLCVAPKYSKPFVSEKNILIPNKVEWFILRLFHKLFHSDDSGIINYRVFYYSKDIVKIGGSIFIESNSFNWKMFVPNKTHVIGANFEHHYTHGFYEQAKERISKTLSCTFRDTFSYRLFSELKNVSFAPDAVFSMKLPLEIIEGYGIAISVIFLDSRSGLEKYAEDYYQSIAEVIDYCESKKIPVGLFGFCLFEKDDLAINTIQERIHSRTYPEICIYDGNIDFFIKKINSYTSVIATRVHAMIIGWKLGKRVLPVIYSDKQQNVLDDIDYQGFLWDIKSNSRIQGDKLTLNAMKAIRIENTNKLSEMSEKQFKVFEDYNGIIGDK